MRQPGNESHRLILNHALEAAPEVLGIRPRQEHEPEHDYASRAMAAWTAWAWITYQAKRIDQAVRESAYQAGQN
jgi:hypothetical protein